MLKTSSCKLNKSSEYTYQMLANCSFLRTFSSMLIATGSEMMGYAMRHTYWRLCGCKTDTNIGRTCSTQLHVKMHIPNPDIKCIYLKPTTFLSGWQMSSCNSGVPKGSSHLKKIVKEWHKHQESHKGLVCENTRVYDHHFSTTLCKKL